MKQNSKFLLVFLALGFLFACARTPQQLVSEKPATSIVDLASKKIRDSIVLIESENGSGTGFFIASDKIATNIHGVAHPGTISVKSPDEERNWAIEGVVGFDVENGLVILKLTGEGKPLLLGDRFGIGEPVSIPGYRDGEFNVVEGKIQSIRNNNRWLSVNTTASKETNGSPVLNNKGQVIAVIVPYNIDSYRYAIPSSVLEVLLNQSVPVEPLAEWQKRKQVRAAEVYNLGVEKFTVKDYFGAVFAFNRAIELNSAYIRAYYERARAQAYRGNYTSAIASCTKVLEMDPDEADAYYARGTIKIYLEDYANAIVDLDKAIELDAQHADAYRNRGGMKFKLGESKSARGNAKEAQRLYEEAIVDCDKALEIDPEDVDTYRNRGGIKFKLGESEATKGNAKEAQRLYEEAIVDCDKALEIDPEDDSAYNNRGMVENGFGELESTRGNMEKMEALYEAAVADYTQAIKINPKHANAYNNRARVKCKLGDIESARGEAENAQRLYHDGITDYDKSIQLNNQKDTDVQTADLDSEIAKNSTVLVLAWSGISNRFFSGSGFFVDRNKIVTNIHVVDSPGPIFAKLGGEETIWTIERVITFDVENDLVILKLAGEGVPLRLGDSDVVKGGETVIAVGYPHKKYKVAHGSIHSIRNSDKWIRMNIDTGVGSSGGPMLNSSGQVIGVNVSSVNIKGKSYALAIPSNTLKALLASLESTELLMEWQNRNHIRAYAYVTQGEEKLKAKRYDEAIVHFDKAIKLNPKNFVSYHERGHAKFALGRHKAAIADFDKAIQLNSEAVYNYFARGHAKRTLGDYEGAIADLDRVIQLYPEHVGLYNIRSAWKVSLGDLKGATFDYNRTIEINPKHADAYKERAHTKFKLADAYKKRAHTKFKLAESKTAQGDIAATLQLYQSAMEDCTQVIWLTPKDADVYDNRGWARFHLGESETARGNMKKAADLYEKAIEDYTQAIKINPEHPYAYRNRAKAKFKLVNYEEAIIDLDKAVQINPKNARYYYDRGRVKEALGQHEAAKADFRKAKSLNPDIGQ